MTAAAIARDTLTLASEPLLLYAPAATTITNLLAAPERFVGDMPPTSLASPLPGSLPVEAKGIGASNENAPQSPVLLAGGLAVLQLRGFLMREYGILAKYGLATSTVMLSEDIKALQRDSRVRSIVMLCDSPGGLAMGNEEAASEIAAGRGSKPMLAIVTGVCASAAYYLAAAMDKIIASPSSLLGSIGTLAMHVDYSEALEKAGLTVSMIQFGERKTDGHPYAPLEGEALKSLQSRIDAYGWQFVHSVAKHRGISPADVRHRYGDGQVFIGTDAVARGLADQVGTFQQTMAAMGTGPRNGSPQLAAKLPFSLGGGTRNRLFLAGVIHSSMRDSPEEISRAVAHWYHHRGKQLPRNEDQLERDLARSIY